MSARNPNEIVAVKCEGCFTEWYSPYFKEPYVDNAEYRRYYEGHIIDVQPVIGPSLGETDEEFISDDLQCLAERICCDSKNWQKAVDEFKAEVENALEYGTAYEAEIADCGVIKITPYRRCEMPKPNEEHLKVYGPYADLMRERVANI